MNSFNNSPEPPTTNLLATMSQPTTILTILPEVFAMIQFSNGVKKEARFDTCEAAWSWEITERKTAANRRAKADRLGVTLSLYAGCTVTGKAYGGILHGHDRFNTELPCFMAWEERRQLAIKRHTWAIWAGILSPRSPR